jgi:hypothetical protein
LSATASGLTTTSVHTTTGSTDLPLNNDVTVGLAVTSHDTSVLRGYHYTVQGSGSDIWGVEDAFNCEYASMINARSDFD